MIILKHLWSIKKELHVHDHLQIVAVKPWMIMIICESSWQITFNYHLREFVRVPIQQNVGGITTNMPKILLPDGVGWLD